MAIAELLKSSDRSSDLSAPGFDVAGSKVSLREEGKPVIFSAVQWRGGLTMDKVK